MSKTKAQNDIYGISIPHKYRMRYFELITPLKEDVEVDLRQQARAESIQHSLMDWLGKHNESAPLKSCPNVYVQKLGSLSMLCVDAVDIGLPRGYSDLVFAFVARNALPPNTLGRLIDSVLEDGAFIHHLLIILPNNPGETIDAAYSMRWDTVVHELIHYFDHRRSGRAVLKKKAAQVLATGRPSVDPGSSKEENQNPEQYYNDPMEVNAHFHQGLYMIMTRLTNLADTLRSTDSKPPSTEFFPSFQEFSRKYRNEFPKGFWVHLNQKNRQRFENRFYALWKLCHDRWPNIDYIQARLRHMDEISAKFAAQDAAAAD